MLSKKDKELIAHLESQIDYAHDKYTNMMKQRDSEHKENMDLREKLDTLWIEVRQLRSVSHYADIMDGKIQAYENVLFWPKSPDGTRQVLPPHSQPWLKN